MNHHFDLRLYSPWADSAIAGRRRLARLAACRGRALNVVAVLVVAFCFVGFVGSETRQEQVARRAEVAQVMTQEELIEEIKKLSRVEYLDGKCIAPGGEGSTELLAYVTLAQKASTMSTEDLIAICEAVASDRAAGHGEIVKLRVIVRLIYHVPDSYPFIDRNLEPDLESKSRGDRFWMESHIRDGMINYLRPLAIDKQGRMCMLALTELFMSYSDDHSLVPELEFFAERFPKRDLSVYLEKQLHKVTLEELIEEIKQLATVPDLAGACIGPGGEGSKELLAYIQVAVKASAMSHEELLAIYSEFNSMENTLSEGDISKLHLLNRFIYDVPYSFKYSGPYNPEIRHWRFTPITDEDLDYLYPLEYDAGQRLCVNAIPISDPDGSLVFRLQSHEKELSYFEKAFPKRDLSVYLRGR